MEFRYSVFVQNKLVKIIVSITQIGNMQVMKEKDNSMLQIETLVTILIHIISKITPMVNSFNCLRIKYLIIE